MPSDESPSAGVSRDMYGDDPDGSYFGTTENMVKVGSKQGYTILRCQHCGEEIPGNWDNASSHVCGRGEHIEGAGCCSDPELSDHWIELESDGAGTSSERKKKCETCGTVHPLGVMNRV